jgi:flagellar biosynthetic protein FlhB
VAESDGRTEAATPARMSKAISQGDIVVSREVTAFATLGGGVVALAVLLPTLLAHLERAFATLLSRAGPIDTTAGMLLLIKPVVQGGFEIVLLTGALTVAGAIAATLFQTGFKLRTNAIGFNLGRINPLTGFSNLFSLRHTIASAQSIVKIILVGIIMYVVIGNKIGALRTQMILPVTNLPAAIGAALLAVAIAGVMVQGVIGAVDLAWSKRQFTTRNQMSQQEVKDEQRESDGDPAVKAKLKALRAQQAKRNLRAAMARATVVVTNPTHYAVALEYQAGQTQAPRVVAKGADHLAKTIREMAAELNLPIVANPPLARALYTLDEDSEITPEHYRAVAEVIAYVWKLAERNAARFQV